VDKDGYQYLEIHLNSDPDDPRADDLPGEIILDGWGLHLIDVNLPFDELSALIGSQTAAHRER
jgi:hypothetical protein